MWAILIRNVGETRDRKNESIDAMRRRVTKVVAYSAPAVLCVMTVKNARAAQVSCMPDNCNPATCMPADNMGGVGMGGM